MASDPATPDTDRIQLNTASLRLRPPEVVMDLERLGRFYPYRLSFMRMLVRRMMTADWQIKRTMLDLDDDGYGEAVYELTASDAKFSFVIFSRFLDPSRRSDRVIAEEWDMTAVFCAGTVDRARIDALKRTVPLQERGRFDSACLVLTRANKSVRNFEHVVESLASGEQPSLSKLAGVGYLYRTTAVYGSGKFGMADWEKVRTHYPQFARPFSAEMFTCFMIRQFSLDQAEYLAERRSPDNAVPLNNAIKRYMGIGNATGLGMAPYLINHPLLIDRWIEVREIALARVLDLSQPTDEKFVRLSALMQKAIQHLSEIATDNQAQNKINETTMQEAVRLHRWLEEMRASLKSWRQFVDYFSCSTSIETQELMNTLLIEIHPEHLDDLEDSMCVTERYEMDPAMPAKQLREIIESKYAWALAMDFGSEGAKGVFWYRSEEKMEPRLGVRDTDAGAERELMVGIAHSVRQCYDALCAALINNDGWSVAEFVIEHPKYRQIVRRVQTLAESSYGDIQANLLDADVKPIHLLRCKLSFFGVSKFDPKSRLWVRNTMFQGAPVVSDIGETFEDDWCFPTVPVIETEKEECPH